MCEDLDNTDGLHHLFEIVKTLFLLDKNFLYDTMFSEAHIMDALGCLEYDPTKKEPQRYRKFLKENVRFREVIPINNPELLAKIHQTYQVQYIMDIVLPTPTVFEENMLPSLNSFLIFSKFEIVSIVQVLYVLFCNRSCKVGETWKERRESEWEEGKERKRNKSSLEVGILIVSMYFRC